MRREQNGLISANSNPDVFDWPDVKALTNEQAKALKVRSPYDSEGPSD